MPKVRSFRLSVHRKNEVRKKYATSKTVTSRTVSTEDIPAVQISTPLRVSIPRDIISVMTVSLPLSSYLEADVRSLSSLDQRLETSSILTSGWQKTSASVEDEKQIVISRIESLNGIAEIKYNLIIRIDFSWDLFYQRERLASPILTSLPSVITSLSDVEDITSFIDSCTICVGSPDEKYNQLVSARKGVFMDSSGMCQVAYLDSQLLTFPTIRSQACELLIPGGARCNKCSEFRKTLNAMLSRHNKRCEKSDVSDPSSHTNYRFLKTPEKDLRMQRLHLSVKVNRQQIERLRARIAKITEERGVVVDSNLHSDLVQIVNDNTPQIGKEYPPHSFPRIFWEQQRRASSLKDRRSMKWHPLMIHWCLYLRHLSSSAYETLRQSGAITLPSQRTLRDYTHYTKAVTGFSAPVDQQLMEAAKISECSEMEKYVFIIMDEMHIKEDVVYDKHTGAITGYVNLGEINSHLSLFEQSMHQSSDSEALAKSMLVLMVRGLFTRLQFPYAQFPCTSLCGDHMFAPFWEAVGRIERCGLKVLGLTCDGLSANRRLFKLHHPKSSSIVYKVPNPYASDGRHIHFVSDPPHLIKTIRNGWQSNKRRLWCNGKQIAWSHLVQLYERNRSQGSAPGLALLPKLKFEHLYLTSFSKMRVDLAAQVLSNSVAKALQLFGGSEAEETAKFVDKCDKFFDCMNVSSLSAGKLKCNPFKAPYRSGHDFRLKWLEEEFIPYLDKWEESVKGREGTFTNAKRTMMMLSPETLLGLRMTVHSFVDLVKYIFTIPGVSAFLSNRICQDPLEKFFGQQRQRGKTNENPNAVHFMKNTQALRVINGVCRGVVKGNCRGSTSGETLAENAQMESTPLPKRKYKHR